MDNLLIIEKLQFKKELLLENVPTFKRTAFSKVEEALNEGVSPILFGLRRTGKTTILIQLLNKYKEESIYITFRDSYISKMSREELSDLVLTLYKYYGIRKLLLDEVQIMDDWSDWAIEVIDSFPKLKLVITGSSSLNLEKRETGLDRTRKINIQTLTFGEYLALSNKVKSETEFNRFLGFGGFPKYVNQELSNFELLRSEIFDEVIRNDIPLDNSEISEHLMARLVYELAKLTNGEINVSSLTAKISPNFLERDTLHYISVLEKSKVLKVIERINSDLTFPKRRKFKIYLNPHIHLWLLDTKFENIDSTSKGHILESYWLHWAMTINNYDKKFYYLKDVKSNQEIDFVSLNSSPVGPRIKSIHEFKAHTASSNSIVFLKSFDSQNKIIWSLDGNDLSGISGKSLLDTFDKEF